MPIVLAFVALLFGLVDFAAKTLMVTAAVLFVLNRATKKVL